ncbi:proline-rich protein 2-like [Lutra lutra]|uniref:proline-rich protein 2-like n=1 Tax=Lutra lutra TaxID=9657 RepID=UPI001FD325E5|nr:proline-rich protein 2-like [Lutra lutra]
MARPLEPPRSGPERRPRLGRGDPAERPPPARPRTPPPARPTDPGLRPRQRRAGGRDPQDTSFSREDRGVDAVSPGPGLARAAAPSVPPSGRQDPTPGEAPGAPTGGGGRPERVGFPSPRLRAPPPPPPRGRAGSRSCEPARRWPRAPTARWACQAPPRRASRGRAAEAPPSPRAGSEPVPERSRTEPQQHAGARPRSGPAEGAARQPGPERGPRPRERLGPRPRTSSTEARPRPPLPPRPPGRGHGRRPLAL